MFLRLRPPCLFCLSFAVSWPLMCVCDCKYKTYTENSRLPLYHCTFILG